MGGNLGTAAPGRRLRIVRPGTALALGVLIVIMSAVSAAANAFGGALRLSSLGEAALWLSFGLVPARRGGRGAGAGPPVLWTGR